MPFWWEKCHFGRKMVGKNAILVGNRTTKKFSHQLHHVKPFFSHQFFPPFSGKNWWEKKTLATNAPGRCQSPGSRWHEQALCGLRLVVSRKLDAIQRKEGSLNTSFKFKQGEPCLVTKPPRGVNDIQTVSS